MHLSRSSRLVAMLAFAVLVVLTVPVARAAGPGDSPSPQVENQACLRATPISI
jgi:hypothetical protein